MDAVYVAAAIPLFFLLIGLELLLTRRAAEPRYAFHDSIANLSCGVGSLIFGALFTFFSVGTYTFAFERFRVATIPIDRVWAWVAVMVLVDLCYYVFHRVSHRVNLFWAAHVVHHQSEEYNLSVALRQAWFEGPLQWVFYIPVALLGFPTVMFVTAITFNTLYQFWIHTRAIDRLGPLEWVLNTPSHHRVHHGTNPKYIDRNYGGILIVWDRLFGTFQAEEEEPVYGLVKPLASFNPIWANVSYWVRIAELARASKGFFEKVSAAVRPPEWLPRELGGVASIPEVSRAAQRKYDVASRKQVDRYLFVHFAIIVGLTTAFLLFEKALAPLELGAVSLWFVATLVSWGGLVEGKPWALGLELARLAAMPVGAWLLFTSPKLAAPIAAGAICACLSAVALLKARAPAPVRA
jgi:alkylglycerol monooxygenase